MFFSDLIGVNPQNSSSQITFLSKNNFKMYLEHLFFQSEVVSERLLTTPVLTKPSTSRKGYNKTHCISKGWRIQGDEWQDYDDFYYEISVVKG
jgi:hypothetical protein